MQDIKVLQEPFAFVDIDTQRDFLEPGGTLFLQGSEAILDNLARLTRFARDRGIPVLATACAHRLDEEDPEPFPPHCLEGTWGQERINQTAWPGSVVLSPSERFPGDRPPAHLTIQKCRYDAFSRPDMDQIVALYGGSTFVLYGVATDYCVRCACEGLLALGRRVVLVADAIWPVDPDREPAVLSELIARGASLALTEVVCRRREETVRS